MKLYPFKTKFAAKDTIKNRNKKSKADSRAAIVIQLATAAAEGNLVKLDPKLLTAENLSLPDSFGLNALHCAAMHAKLHAVPKELLIEEILMAFDDNGQSALHYAAEHNEIKWIPKHIITKTNLLTSDAEHNTVYHYLANYGTLNSIPRNIIDEETILTENDFKKNVLDMALNSESKEADPEHDQSYILLSILSKKSLEMLIRTNPKDKIRIQACTTQLAKKTVMDKVKTQELNEAFDI